MKTAIAESQTIWRPFTQMKDAPAHPKVLRGEGVELFLEDGRTVLDMVSSWWVNVHGHSNKVIAEAIYKQAQTLEHVIYAEFNHEPAEVLGKELTKVLPQDINHLFFSDNGSTAVEVGMKMAYQYWWNLGVKRDKFIAFDGGYHGDTVGAMSLGQSSGFFDPFKKLLFDVDTVAYPAYKENCDIEALETKTLDRIRELASNRKHAAILLEPLVQGAGGMKMCRPQFLRDLEKLAKELELLVIYDEVMTGFGRTGHWFASIKSATNPDIICLSKGITGGFLPLAITACNSKIFNAFYSDDKSKTFFHGHSYTANPVACAAAVASLELMHQNKHQFLELEKTHNELSQSLQNSGLVKNFRVCGTIAAFEVVTDEPDSYFNSAGPKLKKSFLEESLLMRPLGNTAYLMPPFIIDKKMLETVYEKVEKAIKKINND